MIIHEYPIHIPYEKTYDATPRKLPLRNVLLPRRWPGGVEKNLRMKHGALGGKNLEITEVPGLVMTNSLLWKMGHL